MKQTVYVALLIILTCFCRVKLFASVSPYDYGLKEATTGVQRYWALYNAHVEALKRNDFVDYSGIKEIKLEIPKDAMSIPLGRGVNFKGLVLNVKNTAKDLYLFSLTNTDIDIDLPQNKIDVHDFSDIKELATGTKLLIIEDRTPWVNERKGFNHAVFRKDILLLKNGVSQNNTVMPYDENTVSKPTCSYVNADNKQKKIQNLVFIRSVDCTYKTCLAQIEGQNNVLLKNLKTYTPADEMLYGDHIINIVNCTNVTFRDINIEGVYCPKDTWGYGIGMDNVYNVKFYNVTGSGTVFGCNSINTSYLRKCNLFRYDIHCYGRDVRMDKCFFWGSGFRTSSFYGDLIYNKCTLKYYLPVSIRNEYNCNVPYNLVIKDCTYYMSNKYNYVIYTGNTDYQNVRRPELEEKCLPNILIDGLKIIPDDDVRETFLFFVGHQGDVRFGHLREINVRNIDLQGNIDFKICTSSFEVKNKARIIFQKKWENGVDKVSDSIVAQ